LVPTILETACLAVLSTPIPALNIKRTLGLQVNVANVGSYDYNFQPTGNILASYNECQKNIYTLYQMLKYLPAPTTTIFCLTKSFKGRPCALIVPSSPARATPAVPC